MGLHRPTPSPLNQINVINATANEFIESRHWMQLEVKDLMKTFFLQKVNIDDYENPSARN